MSPVKRIQQQVKDRLEKDGTLARIDALHSRRQAAAKELGYTSAQAAFNALGKSFSEADK